MKSLLIFSVASWLANPMCQSHIDRTAPQSSVAYMQPCVMVAPSSRDDHFPAAPAITAPVPETKPELPKLTKVTKVTKRTKGPARSAACGARRQIWRTLANGHRMYRCKK